MTRFRRQFEIGLDLLRVSYPTMGMIVSILAQKGLQFKLEVGGNGNLKSLVWTRRLGERLYNEKDGKTRNSTVHRPWRGGLEEAEQQKI